MLDMKLIQELSEISPTAAAQALQLPRQITVLQYVLPMYKHTWVLWTMRCVCSLLGQTVGFKRQVCIQHSERTPHPQHAPHGTCRCMLLLWLQHTSCSYHMYHVTKPKYPGGLAPAAVVVTAVGAAKTENTAAAGSWMFCLHCGFCSRQLYTRQLQFTSHKLLTSLCPRESAPALRYAHTRCRVHTQTWKIT